ncbi:hypothetical protein Pint_26623 [Pistacia integerrima]|uniref:Uncharacterized protein n=1 Tax=Pistacia integerrima TaxID=434235 RepID=A0ACC0YUC1_9ROSI|nr:hypothetical protein Pint_26623 [Pistacia integerrima]
MEMEGEVLKALMEEPSYPPIYPIGPLTWANGSRLGLGSGSIGPLIQAKGSRSWLGSKSDCV